MTDALRSAARAGNEVRAETSVAMTIGPRTVVGQTPSMRGGCPEEPARFHPCALAKARTFNPPRTPDGKPDLQGFWIAEEDDRR